MGRPDAFQKLQLLPWRTQIEMLERNDIRYRDAVDSFTVLYESVEVRIAAPDSGTERQKISCPCCGQELEIEVGNAARLIENRELSLSYVHQFEDVTSQIESAARTIELIKKMDVPSRAMFARASAQTAASTPYGAEIILGELLKDSDESVRQAAECAMKDLKEGRVPQLASSQSAFDREAIIGCAVGAVLLVVVVVICYNLFQ